MNGKVIPPIAADNWRTSRAPQRRPRRGVTVGPMAARSPPQALKRSAADGREGDRRAERSAQPARPPADMKMGEQFVQQRVRELSATCPRASVR
jgi:hypothetical protein